MVMYPSPGASRHPLPAARGEGQQLARAPFPFSPAKAGEKVAEGRMRGQRERGFSLLETVVTLVVFGVVVTILLMLTAELRGHDKRYPVNLMKHPQVSSVLSRMRKDVLDAFGTNPYPASYLTHSQSDTKLIVYSVQQSGFTQTVVWDFGDPGVVRRTAYSVGGVVSDWYARGVPASFKVTTFEIPNRPYAVRLQGADMGGRLAIDQIFQPRAHN